MLLTVSAAELPKLLTFVTVVALDKPIVDVAEAEKLNCSIFFSAAGVTLPLRSAVNTSVPAPPSNESRAVNVCALDEFSEPSKVSSPDVPDLLSVPVVSDQVNRKFNSLKIK